MGFATALSNLVGFIVLLLHFRQKDHVLHFSTKNLDFSCVNEALYIGVPGISAYWSQVFILLS